MKREGWWLNWNSGKQVAVWDHERDIRIPKVAKRLGVPDTIFRQFGRFTPGQDRVRFLRWLIKRAPLMRFRDHGDYVTFEYAATSDRKPMAAVRIWAGRCCGPATLMRLANLRSRRHRTLPAHELKGEVQ